MLQLHSGFGVFLRPCAKAKCKTKNASNLAPNFGFSRFSVCVCGNCGLKMQMRTLRPFGWWNRMPFWILGDLILRPYEEMESRKKYSKWLRLKPLNDAQSLTRCESNRKWHMGSRINCLIRKIINVLKRAVHCQCKKNCANIKKTLNNALISIISIHYYHE